MKEILNMNMRNYFRDKTRNTNPFQTLYLLPVAEKIFIENVTALFMLARYKLKRQSI